MQVLPVQHAAPKFGFLLQCILGDGRHTKQPKGKILMLPLQQYSKRGQYLMPSEATYKAVQMFFMGSENIVLHSKTQPWKN